MKSERANVKQVYTLDDLPKRDSLPSTLRLGIFGDPVEHSLSPQIQNAALKHCQLDLEYGRFQIAPDELAQAVEFARKANFLGINLTLPHKVAALDLMNRVEGDARRIGAVNVVKIVNGKLHGFNTDAPGFSRAIREEFSVDLRDLRVMILGAGGAARAIALQCAKEHCERLVIANGTFEKGKLLADTLRDFFEGPKVYGPVPRLQAIAWEENAFRFQIANVDLIVNATPLGLRIGDSPPIAAQLLAPHLMVYDTIYSHKRTPLVSAALEAGARAANGLSMLLYQGALSFEIWFEREAPLDIMRQALR
jgi:shikimate dehydrogenase